MQSGVLWSSWCKNQNYSTRGFKLAALLGEKSTNPETVIEFLRKVPAEDIVKVQSNIVTLEVRNFSTNFTITNNFDRSKHEWDTFIPVDRKNSPSRFLSG